MSRASIRQRRLGRMLVLYRASRQVTLRDLAAESGISYPTLSRIERGHAMDADTMLLVWRWLLSEEAEAAAS